METPNIRSEKRRTSQYWFTADTHFGHRRIIEFCHRPFADVEEMNDRIIANINDVVAPEDTLFHLGDFSFGRCKNTNDAKTYLDRITCQNIIIIPGNHDPHLKNMLPKPQFAALFTACCPFYRLKTEVDDEAVEIFMFHYSCRVWPKSHYGAWHLYGHSHGNLDDLPNLPSPLCLDVGVDSNDFRPLNLYDLKAKFADRPFVPIHMRD